MLNQQLVKTLFVLLSAAINLVDAKSCVEQVPVKNFQRNRYAGVWSEHARFLGQNDGRSCTKYLLLVDDDENDDTFVIVAMCVDDSKNSEHMTLRNGTLDENGEGVGLSGHPFTVIAIDYDLYAVIFACDEAKDELLVWVLTRETDPSSDTLSEISEVLNEYEIYADDLDYIPGYDCPSDWSKSEVNEADFSYTSIKKELRRNKLIGA